MGTHSSTTTNGVDPVVIVGAGQGGMTLAHILHRHGVPCTVLERQTKQRVYETGRAGLFDHTSAMIIDQYDLSQRINTKEWLAPPLGRHKSCYLSRVEGNGDKKVVTWSPVKVIEQDLQEQGEEWMDLWNPLFPQTEIVLDMHNKAEKDGIDVRFGVQVDEISGYEPGSSGPVEVKFRRSEDAPYETLKASYVVGCGGYHDPVRRIMKENTPDLFVEKNVDWGPITLGLFADSVPSTDKIIYGFHPDGMGAHMIRTNTLSRYYLEVEADISEEASVEEKIDALEKTWTDEKIWAALKKRLGIPDLDTGKITSKAFFRTQHYVVESMNIGKACLAGDAAHSRPYLGARGANNAVQDAYVLAELLVKAHKEGSTRFQNANLSSYAEQRVPCLYESAKFTFDFYKMCFRAKGEDEKGTFLQAITQPIFDNLWESMERINRGNSEPLDILSKWFSYCYVQPCSQAKSVDEWFDIKPAGKGIRQVKQAALTARL